ncbi:calcium ATPase [Gonapodya prolifera JEL478]|uniref:Calcium ATPase n=1 Tax=Gonapodya prolifera (strain JEL478) TaxID=1344416 RepID=A0A139AH72_GONPJ|nr:calcium ATPase [Gonapodya prolifera JEL478]|eukprot:KXS15914.1 calcium ATPase [Gonapodya prolifera JEL478]
MWLAAIIAFISYEPLGGDNPSTVNLYIGIFLLVVIAVQSSFYAYQDWNSSKIMNSIRNLMADKATVTRGGTKVQISAVELCKGDLIHLTLGDRVPADVRLVEVSSDLKFDRSLLTGESLPVSGTVNYTDKNVLETRNIALSGTFVLQGSASGIVVAIGDGTVMSHIAHMATSRKESMTTLQREIWWFTVIISGIAIVLFCVTLIVWAAWLRVDYPDFETVSVAILNSLGILTSFIPQGLPIAMTLGLTLIAKKMARQQLLVKSLTTVETLGCVSVVCSDKTGTLTMGKMVRPTLPHSEGPGKTALHHASALCVAASFDGETSNLPLKDRKILGDPTDAAVLRFAETLAPTVETKAKFRNVFSIPFNSKNKWMLRITKDGDDGAHMMYVKGAPDILIDRCASILGSNGVSEPMDLRKREQISEIQENWSASGERVLALCRRSLQDITMPFDHLNLMEAAAHKELQSLTLVGLLGIIDPPRPEIKECVSQMRKAGVRVFMVTGDFRLTAVAIAKQVGIVINERIDTLENLRSANSGMKAFADMDSQLHDLLLPAENIALGQVEREKAVRSLVVDGSELAALTASDWDTIESRYTEVVFARTMPDQKLRIVEEIKARGDNTVAVTGDGVNDAPALKAADVGVAMGSGSDVAKEAAAMVLLNSDFTGILAAIESGRLVFDNLRKVVLFQMPMGTYTELWTVIFNVFFGTPPFLSSFLMVIFCVSNDILMALSLMYEKPEEDLMTRKPRNAKKDRLANWKFFVMIYGLIGNLLWPCCFGMALMYLNETAGIGIRDLVFAFDKWQDGYLGYSIDELNNFNSVAQCIYYVTMVITQFGVLLSVRTRRNSILSANPLWGPRQNLRLFGAMLVSVLWALAWLYGPGIQFAFGTMPVPVKYWFIPFGFALGILVLDETRKLVVRTFPKSIVAKVAW